MTHQQKIEWMAVWCARNHLALEFEGECGFGRECVGILAGDTYPDYHWYNGETYVQEDENGEVWIPKSAYHKHDCVAVLGRGEDAESQLYEWLVWFDKNGFKLETGIHPNPSRDPIMMMLGKHKFARMVKQKGA